MHRGQSSRLRGVRIGHRRCAERGTAFDGGNGSGGSSDIRVVPGGCPRLRYGVSTRMLVGAGGGGYFGGGGSSFAAPSVTNSALAAGVNTGTINNGNGEVTITWTPAPPPTRIPATVPAGTPMPT